MKSHRLTIFPGCIFFRFTGHMVSLWLAHVNHMQKMVNSYKKLWVHNWEVLKRMMRSRPYPSWDVTLEKKKLKMLKIRHLFYKQWFGSCVFADALNRESYHYKYIVATINQKLYSPSERSRHYNLFLS